MQELKGSVAVVTGGSRGIGRAIALELARAGAAVLVHGGHHDDAAAAVASEVAALGAAAETTVCDLSRADAQDALVERAWSWRPIDIWVNNAGADLLSGEPAAWPFERKLEALWQLDVTASIRLSRQAGARMKSRGGGVVINMGWDQAWRGMAGDSGELFAAAKGAVMAFTLSLAHSLAPEVRVNCLAPGWIKTAWGEQASPYWQKRAESESLLARWGTPEDVARVARFLASPAAGFVTGQVVPVNGGLR
jgi:3-oxoacyl-[acyl-carrier protein] reductase